MRLRQLRVENFRCLRSVVLDVSDLTVLIGENNVGKSTMLDALELSLGLKAPDERDFWTVVDREGRRQAEDEIQVELEFQVSESDPDSLAPSIDGVVTFRRTWTLQSADAEFLVLQPVDKRLQVDTSKLKRSELDDLINSLPGGDHTTLKTVAACHEWLREHVSLAPKTKAWQAAPARWHTLLPRLERFRALDYGSPEALVMKTLKGVFDDVVNGGVVDAGSALALDRRLEEVRVEAEERIRQKVRELEEHVARYVPDVRGISFEPVIDFTNGFRSGELQVDDGRGLHFLSRVGDGTKRRILMGAVDWDRQVTLADTESGASRRSVIRGYDEPDTNLHYGAQRTMYRAIEDIVFGESSRTQAVLCTHSLTMIDRAPATSIRHLSLNLGATAIEQLALESNDATEQFLGDLARQLGISNSIMFFERCFILIEGETEENALPTLYRLRHGRSPIEDGIRIINVRGNGNAKEFLRLMGRNRQAQTVVFLDEDTRTDDSGQRSKMNEDVLRQSGFPPEFFATRLLFIGDREFEDAFSDVVLARALNGGFPHRDRQWSVDDCSGARNGKKFSDELGRLVFESAAAGVRWGKPEFGSYLARACKFEDVPPKVLRLFDVARTVAGVDA